jgi:hypothetical protein
VEKFKKPLYSYWKVQFHCQNDQPKLHRGPVAGNFYPTKPGEPIKRAINNYERKEASILTHTTWISDPLGNKICHFLDIINDEIGSNGISIHCNREFEEEAQWNYLAGMMGNIIDEETVARIAYTHQRLPKLFSKMKTKPRITYPFKYDCV